MRSRAFLFGSLLALASSYGQAAVTITIQEMGGNVVATATGSLDTSSAVSSATSTVMPLIEYVSADSYAYIVGVGGGSSATAYTATFGTAQPLNSVAISALADVSTGGPVGIDAVGAGSVLFVAPVGYVSGAPINSSSTWNGRTLASLNLTPGNFAFNFGSDSITYIVGEVPSAQPPVAVPVGTAFTTTLTGLGLVAAAWGRLRRRRN